MGYIYTVTCDSCDYQSTYKSGAGLCLLSIDNKIQKYIKSEIASYYCNNCDGVQLFFLGKPEKSQNIKDFEKQYQQRVNELEQTSTILFPIWFYKKIRAKNALKRLNAEIISNSFEDNVKYWNSLNVKPRCFNCGGTSDHESLGLIHKCGGRLVLTRKAHFQGDALDIIHDFEGKVIEKRARPLRQPFDFRSERHG